MTLTTPRLVFRTHNIDTTIDGSILAGTSMTTNTVSPGADLAVYVPVRVRYTGVIVSLWVASGSTGTGNIDVGLYSEAGTRLVSSGTTAKLASAAEQVLDVTDTLISRGIYYLALVSSNATDTFYADADAAPICAGLGLLTESLGSTVLPATASWAVNQTLAFNPRIGMMMSTVVT